MRAASIRATAAAPSGPRLLWLRSRSVKQFANGHRSVAVASPPKAAAPASSVAPPVLKPTNMSVMMAAARWSILLRESTRVERQRALRIPTKSVLRERRERECVRAGQRECMCSAKLTLYIIELSSCTALASITSII